MATDEEKKFKAWSRGVPNVLGTHARVAARIATKEANNASTGVRVTDGKEVTHAAAKQLHDHAAVMNQKAADASSGAAAARFAQKASDHKEAAAAHGKADASAKATSTDTLKAAHQALGRAMGHETMPERAQEKLRMASAVLKGGNLPLTSAARQIDRALGTSGLSDQHAAAIRNASEKLNDHMNKVGDDQHPRDDHGRFAPK